jgi:16S rRNA (cytosine1402-N4)-methyltransferase
VREDTYRHIPVLLDEALCGLALRPDALAVDGTFGRGGHSRAILAALGPEGRLLALDRDPDAIASEPATALKGDPRFGVEHARFSQLADVVARRGWSGSVNGILLDLGVSSPQLDEARRGFSFLRDGPLDMRMDTGSGLSAARWLAQVAEEDLAAVISELGEERYARRIARAIVAARAQQPLETTSELARLIERAVPTREPGKHPATRTFQAIRIAINQELEELDAVLQQAVEILAPGGRLAVIAFHSLEDRRVKRFMRDEERGGQPAVARLPLPPRRPSRLRRIGKAITPGPEEMTINPRARSAVLRIAERVAP